MSLKIAARAAALVVILAALPAPASAQLGFIKKQLKQKIVHTVVDSALNRVAGPAADSSKAAAPAVPAESTAAAPSTSSRVGGFLKKKLGKKILPAADSQGGAATQSSTARAAASPPSSASATGAAAQGVQFDALVVEITPQSLAQLEKFLTAQKAQRDKPEQPAGYALGIGAGGDPTAIVRFSMMTQRVVAFCSATTDPQTAAALSMYGSPNELSKSFEPSEIAVLRPRCPKLMSLFRSDS